MTATTRNQNASQTASDCDRPIWQVRLSRLIADRGITVEHGRGYGPDARHRFDRYLPKGGADPARAAIVFVYGGSWTTGERGCYAFAASALAKRGFEVLVPDYRLYPDVRFPEFIDDIAMAYGHAALARKRGQPTPALVGHSAGAHIAALLSLDPAYRQRVDGRLPKPSAFVGLSGPYGFDPTTWDTTAEIFATTADEPDRARPVAQARASAPPTLLLHGGRDTIVTPDASQLLHDALATHGVTVDLKIYDWLAHAGPVLAFARPLRWLIPLVDDIAGFLDRHARG